MRRNRDQNGQIKRCSARFVVYGNEEYDFVEDSFAPVADYVVSKLMMRLSIQHGWVKRHLDFDNAFLNSLMERLVDVELPRH